MRKPTRARPLLAYVGSYTTPERHGDGDGINVYRVDRSTGAFTHLQRLGGLENPSFLAINAQGTRLYSVHGDRSEINSFTIDPRTGHLAPLNRQPTGGYNPVHLAFDATGRFLAVCNYGTDSLAVFPLAADGSLLPYRTLTTVTGTLGPHRIQQRTMCVHHIPLDAQGRFFYVPCKGSDAVVAYRLDTRRKILVEAARVNARPGAAPRHIDFHPAKALAYVVNELDSTITTYRSACSASTAPKARSRRGSGCRPMAARRASSPSVPISASSTSPTRTAARSSPTASAATAGWRRAASG